VLRLGFEQRETVNVLTQAERYMLFVELMGIVKIPKNPCPIKFSIELKTPSACIDDYFSSLAGMEIRQL
jgi:hypothetical protein